MYFQNWYYLATDTVKCHPQWWHYLALYKLAPPPLPQQTNPSTKILRRAHGTLKSSEGTILASPSSPLFAHLVLVDQHVRSDITRCLVCQRATNRIPKRFLLLKSFATKIVLKIIYRSRHEVTHLESQN